VKAGAPVNGCVRPFAKPAGADGAEADLVDQLHDGSLRLRPMEVPAAGPGGTTVVAQCIQLIALSGLPPRTSCRTTSYLGRKTVHKVSMGKTPAAPATSTSRRAWSASSARGFSTRTCYRPASPSWRRASRRTARSPRTGETLRPPSSRDRAATMRCLVCTCRAVVNRSAIQPMPSPYAVACGEPVCDRVQLEPDDGRRPRQLEQPRSPATARFRLLRVSATGTEVAVLARS
jgi:hypothetical protein